MAVWLWLIAAGVLFVLETLTADLLFASLALSATAAMVTAWGGGGFLAQGIAFTVSAIVTVFLLRPLALREMAKRTRKTATNTEALLGLRAKTLSAVDADGGQIKLQGEVWSARSPSGTIRSGQAVTVDTIDGAIAVVSPHTT